MKNTVHFSIKYDGPALTNHQMDVRELAPALIALSELLEQANKAAYPDAAEIRVNVQGNFKSGSFGVDLIATQSISQQIVSLLTSPEVSAAANLLGILGGLGLLGGGGVIGLVKWLRGRKPSTIRNADDKVIFELRETVQVESFEVDLVTAKLYQTRVVRQSLAKVVKPLENQGIDVFACGTDGQTQAVVTRAEREWFDLAASEADVVSDTAAEGVLLQIESAVFREDNKWRFSDGATAFYAEITDQDFMTRVQSGQERFGKGDVLVVDLRRIQTVSDSGLKQEFIVTKVRQHKAPLQQSLI